MAEGDAIDVPSTDTAPIREWRSIVTLVVFVITNIIVLAPFHIPIYIPRRISDSFLDLLSRLRILDPRDDSQYEDDVTSEDDDGNGKRKRFVKVRFPVNMITAPLIADLFLLAILAIGRDEVYGGTVGAQNIAPYDIMIFFITLAYIAISIDASGLIRYLAFKVLQKGGKVGHRLFFYLYSFFFVLGSFIGNDPIILSGTAFLSYMTRVSSNIVHPRAWIHTQFAVANIASAILVSSNPTNLVLAGAFQVRFIVYTANMIVPVLVTAIVLFPFLLYIVFADENLIPLSIKMHELSEEAKAKPPVNPNIPNARGNAAQEEEEHLNDEQGKLMSLEEIMNPFLDKKGATFGGVIMALTLIAVLALNASSSANGEHPVFYVTLPAAVVMFCWDLGYGWKHRHVTRQIARKGRQEVEEAQAAKVVRRREERRASLVPQPASDATVQNGAAAESAPHEAKHLVEPPEDPKGKAKDEPNGGILVPATVPQLDEKQTSSSEREEPKLDLKKRISEQIEKQQKPRRATLASFLRYRYRWAQETFPTTMAVLAHLPFPLIPFAFSMFVLVQALVTKGWVPVFAYGWDHWVTKTGTIGAIGGMGFLSVILCNFAGTNIGTTILLSRVIQSWMQISKDSNTTITDRTFWATVYAMALGVNYGAFSTAFSASLAGLLWRDILARKHIRVRSLDFARVNLPIIAISMVVGCAVLVGEVYIVRTDNPYSL